MDENSNKGDPVQDLDQATQRDNNLSSDGADDSDHEDEPEHTFDQTQDDQQIGQNSSTKISLIPEVSLEAFSLNANDTPPAIPSSQLTTVTLDYSEIPAPKKYKGGKTSLTEAHLDRTIDDILMGRVAHPDDIHGMLFLRLVPFLNNTEITDRLDALYHCCKLAKPRDSTNAYAHRWRDAYRAWGERKGWSKEKIKEEQDKVTRVRPKGRKGEIQREYKFLNRPEGEDPSPRKGWKQQKGERFEARKINPGKPKRRTKKKAAAGSGVDQPTSGTVRASSQYRPPLQSGPAIPALAPSQSGPATSAPAPPALATPAPAPSVAQPQPQPLTQPRPQPQPHPPPPIPPHLTQPPTGSYLLMQTVNGPIAIPIVTPLLPSAHPVTTLTGPHSFPQNPSQPQPQLQPQLFAPLNPTALSQSAAAPQNAHPSHPEHEHDESEPEPEPEHDEDDSEDDSEAEESYHNDESYQAKLRKIQNQYHPTQNVEILALQARLARRMRTFERLKRRLKEKEQEQERERG